ncbi:MAG TPA: ComEA family DNA-binding protein [Chloroflexi bacterium]|jgi:competence protein ComEA|nr:ComEA family DNA-binding protein [Chloroflexota bacterium]
MERVQRFGHGVLLVFLGMALASGGWAIAHWPRPEPITIALPTAPPTAAPTPSEGAPPLQVHVTGAVVRAGVYRLPPGSRLIDAVAAAGGMAPDADEERINLADHVHDGQQVYVPRQGTPPPPQPTPMPLPEVLPDHASPSGGAAAPQARVNINTASAAELESLPGIGPALAQRIIAYRQAHGGFGDAAEIVAVSGIGEATYAKLADRITVR